MTLNEWSILGIYIGVISFVRILSSYYLRKKMDTDGNGAIDPDEVQFLNITQDMPVVVEHPGLYDLSIMSQIRTFVEAMLHAFCYGSIVVFSMNLAMNLAMPNNSVMDKKFAYLVTIYMIQMACMFMCHFSTNGIHVVTSNTIHFFYYGFGFIPMVFFWQTPKHKYLIAIAVLLTLFIMNVSRRIAFPQYPTPEKLTRLYKLDDDDNNNTRVWRLASVPSTRIVQDITTSNNEDQESFLNEQSPQHASSIILGETKAESPFTWACVFPTYEILNTHISSSFTIGILTGLITSNLVGAASSSGLLATTLLSISVVPVLTAIIQSFGIYGTAENKMHKKVLANFWPKTTAVVLSMMGAAAVAIQLHGPIMDGDADASSNDIVYWVGVGSLVTATAIGLTFVQSVLAKRAHNNNIDI